MRDGATQEAGTSVREFLILAIFFFCALGG